MQRSAVTTISPPKEAGDGGRARYGWQYRRDWSVASIVGVVVMVVWSFLLGLIITLVGLIAFGGFAKGKWY